MKRFGWVAVLGLVAASFAACGDDDGGDDGDAASASASAAASEASGDGSSEGGEVDEAEAQATVDAAIAAFESELEANGFVAEPESSEEEEPFQFSSEECREFDAAFPGEGGDVPGDIAEAESASFQRTSEEDPLAGGAFVQGFAGVVDPEADEVREVFELLEDDRLADCMREAFQQGMEESQAADPEAPAPEMSIDVQRTDPIAGVDDGAALAISGTMGVVGLTFDLGGEIHFVRKGERVALMLAFGFGAPMELDTTGLVETLLG